jgi:hypothetical protein
VIQVACQQHGVANAQMTNQLFTSGSFLAAANNDTPDPAVCLPQLLNGSRQKFKPVLRPEGQNCGNYGPALRQPILNVRGARQRRRLCPKVRRHDLQVPSRDSQRDK